MRLLWLLPFLGLALGLEAGFKEADINGDGRPERVAVTNLMDLAFGPKGEVLGWYVKLYKGTEIRDYARAQGNLAPNGPVITPLGFTPREAQFEVKDGELLARFIGEEGSLLYRIQKGRYTLEVEADFPLTLKLSPTGTPKILLEGQAEPLPSGEGKALYLAWQTRPKAGYALVAYGGPFEARLLGREGEVRPAPGKPLKVYGGQNELVRFHVEGLLGLPGLFEPNLWGQLSLGLLWVMETAHAYTGSWGLAILILTLLVRLLLWPLMHQQFKSMAEMQRLQPIIQEINKKYKDNPEKRAEATMKLYQEHKVNPLSGCLPLFLQLPILFLLWKVIANYEFGQGLLWIPDLALPDPLYILPILYLATAFLSTWLSAHGNKDIVRQSLFMNAIFLFLILQFPAGVTLYWVLSNLIGLFQQWLINRSLKPLKA